MSQSQDYEKYDFNISLNDIKTLLKSAIDNDYEPKIIINGYYYTIKEWENKKCKKQNVLNVIKN